MARVDDDRFEEDVRRVADQLFPGSRVASGRFMAERERDGLYDDGDTIHIFEATTSRKKEKVEGDISKSVSLVAQIRRDKPSHNVKIWIITSEPPTVDQEQAAINGRKRARCPVEVLSYSALYSRLFDARDFLRLRLSYPFGSVRNPGDPSRHVGDNEYVQSSMLDKKSGKTWTASELRSSLSATRLRAIVLGEYGAGKSMALRHIFSAMYKNFMEGRCTRFPIYLNLRDHFGQSNPAEALMRHANNLGLTQYNRLIGAWRAGFADLILDGFDELSPAQFATSSKNLRAARRSATELVSEFVTATPRDATIMIAGRRHYFDSSNEMLAAFSADQEWSIYNLSEFNDEQVETYLRLRGSLGAIPS